MYSNVPSSLCRSLFCGIVSLFVIMACQKKEDKTLTEVAIKEQRYFHKGVGAPIDSATANLYRRNLRGYLSKNRATATTTTMYYLPAAELRYLINRDNCVGVLFYFGKDSAGGVHVAPIGVDNRGYVMPTATVSTTAGMVPWKVVKQWREHFKQQYPDGSTPWGYFWGSIAVRRLLDQGTEIVRIELGMKDDSSQTLLFSNAADLTPTSYEDRVKTCPPMCAEEEELN